MYNGTKDVANLGDPTTAGKGKAPGYALESLCKRHRGNPLNRNHERSEELIKLRKRSRLNEAVIPLNVASSSNSHSFTVLSPGRDPDSRKVVEGTSANGDSQLMESRVGSNDNGFDEMHSVRVPAAAASDSGTDVQCEIDIEPAHKDILTWESSIRGVQYCDGKVGYMSCSCDRRTEAETATSVCDNNAEVCERVWDHNEGGWQDIEVEDYNNKACHDVNNYVTRACSNVSTCNDNERKQASNKQVEVGDERANSIKFTKVCSMMGEANNGIHNKTAEVDGSKTKRANGSCRCESGMGFHNKVTTAYIVKEACADQVESDAERAETCAIAAGIKLPRLPQSEKSFSANFDWSPVNNSVEFIITQASVGGVKHLPNNPTRCRENLIEPEQESQLGYESHVDGGIMVNGFIVVHNKGLILMCGLRGDKANGSHINSGFGSLRSKSGLEQFRDTHNEATITSFRENRHVNYAQSSHKAEIVGASNLAGVYSESDIGNKPFGRKQALHDVNDVPAQDQKSFAGHMSTTKIPDNTEALKPKSEVTLVSKNIGYNKPTYPVLVGNYVRVYLTKLFAILPRHSKFMVKERIPTSSGMARAKLTLKWSSPLESDKFISEEDLHLPPETDTVYGKPVHYRENCRSPGFIIYTCDGNFSGNVKYPLPSGKAVNSKIGKGGNGFVFTIYHQRKQYAVKKTVYRANEVNVHAALRHENILPLVAVLMGERHEHHKSKFYCFHFMPIMDCDLRQILSAREVGCLKHFYMNCSKEPVRWETGFNNIKFILGETLKALIYLHDNGYVHRDVKASNIMIKMQCRCKPLSCRCSSKFQVKLGDFDSAGTVPGLGIKEPTDQMIKFASILPLGTPGYRAPEVSMHITLSGPYETLYTFAVDMWSFGCLCLNICIGKTAALRQREEASLLLSRTHPCSTELWEKTTKIKELERAKPFIHEKALINLVRSCLQVNGGERPSARDALKVFKLG